MQLAKPVTPAEEFLAFAFSMKVLRFGEFKTKAERLSPYFFNAGLFNDGNSLGQLANFYADAIIASGVEFDMLFGPAYKGIPLVATIAVALVQKERNVPFAYNRKEAKDHGEGGNIVGAPLAGRVLVIDDVISAGTSVRESVELIHAAGAEFAGLSIALDRQEKGKGELSAVQEVQRDYGGIPVVAIATRTDLQNLLGRTRVNKQNGDYLAEILENMEKYAEQYGVC